jgi:hypothetical protein
MIRNLSLIVLLLILTVGANAATDTAGALTVKFTTSQTSTPEYAPKNIVACWIVDSSNKFVKTLLAYAAERKSDLTSWKAITSSSYNVTDAVTGATKTSHAARTCTWNGTNTAGAAVADGTYTVYMECCDNSSGVHNLASFQFTKGTSSQTLSPATTNKFSAISIAWVPNFTAVNVVTEESVRVFTDNDQKFLNVAGDGLLRTDIYNLVGKKVISSTEAKINISSLPASSYIVSLRFKEGNVTRKFVKRQ